MVIIIEHQEIFYSKKKNHLKLFTKFKKSSEFIILVIRVIKNSHPGRTPILSKGNLKYLRVKS